MNKKNTKELINEILEGANSDETKKEQVNELAHYLFSIKEAKEAREKQRDINKDWNQGKEEKTDIIINKLK